MGTRFSCGAVNASLMWLGYSCVFTLTMELSIAAGIAPSSGYSNASRIEMIFVSLALSIALGLMIAIGGAALSWVFPVIHKKKFCHIFLFAFTGSVGFLTYLFLWHFDVLISDHILELIFSMIISGLVVSMLNRFVCINMGWCGVLYKDPSQCSTCGYDLRGSYGISGICPECGEDITENTPLH